MTDDHGRRAPSPDPEHDLDPKPDLDPKSDRDPASGPRPAQAPDPAAVARLRLVLARLHRQMAQASNDERELTFAQLSALARTDEYGPLRIGELAVHEQVAAPSLTRTVQPLSAAGLIRKEADPSDGRSWLVSITPAGRELLGKVRRERSELLSRRMSRLTADQLDTLLAALPVLEMLQSDPPAKPQAGARTGPQPAPALDLGATDPRPVRTPGQG